MRERRIASPATAQECYLCADRIERRLNKRSRGQQLLVLIQEIAQEFFTVGQTAETRSRNDRIDRCPLQTFQCGQHAHPDRTAHTTSERRIGDKRLRLGRQGIMRGKTLYVTTGFHSTPENKSEAQFPPNPNEFESTFRNGMRPYRVTGRRSVLGSGVVKRRLG